VPRMNLNDLQSFVTTARLKSFTRAAAALGVTPSALSQTISGLEAKLDIRLLTRTTRSVSVTEAGERLLQSVGHRIDEISAELDHLTGLRDKPAGLVRITCSDHILRSTLLPKLAPLLREFSDIRVEFDVSNTLRDIVADRFDAGVRLGETIDKDMVAVPIGPRQRMAAVAAPSYLKGNPAPKKPEDLVAHRCINLRLPTQGGLYVWEFERCGRKINVRTDGQLILNSAPHIVDAALGGLGIAFLTEEEFSPHLENGKLVRLLDDWCAPFDGYYLYYPSRKQPSAAFALVAKALRAEVLREDSCRRHQ
jgi:DNA-binding transcriptional LysR family regulator